MCGKYVWLCWTNGRVPETAKPDPLEGLDEFRSVNVDPQQNADKTQKFTRQHIDMREPKDIIKA